MLGQRSAHRNVEYLHPTADAKQRQATIDRELGESELKFVALSDDRPQFWMTRLPVELGINVRAAREDQPVDQIKVSIRVGWISNWDGDWGHVEGKRLLEVVQREDG